MSSLQNTLKECHKGANNTEDFADKKTWIDHIPEVSDYEGEEESDLDSGCESDESSVELDILQNPSH